MDTVSRDCQEKLVVQSSNLGETNKTMQKQGMITLPFWSWETFKERDFKYFLIMLELWPIQNTQHNETTSPTLAKLSLRRRQYKGIHATTHFFMHRFWGQRIYQNLCDPKSAMKAMQAGLSSSHMEFVGLWGCPSCRK